MQIHDGNPSLIASFILQKGWSPLMEAARGGFKGTLEELAKRGADLNMRTVRALAHPKVHCQPYGGNGPRDEAMRMQQLCASQLNTILYTQEAGESAIHAATVKGHVNVMRVLANYGADLNMPNKVCSCYFIHITTSPENHCNHRMG